MPHAKHNRRVKELLVTRRAAANGVWQKIVPERHVRSLSLKKSRKRRSKVES